MLARTEVQSFEAMPCPCCAQPMVGTASLEQIATYLHMTPTERAIFNFMVRRFGQYVDTRQIVEHVYASHPDGGPDSAEKVVHISNYHLRRKLMAYGLGLRGYQSRGGSGTTRLYWLGEGTR